MVGYATAPGDRIFVTGALELRLSGYRAFVLSVFSSSIWFVSAKFFPFYTLQNARRLYPGNSLKLYGLPDFSSGVAVPPPHGDI